MAKARVYELAKELGVGNKEILEQLKKKNVEVKNHMSTVEDNVAEEIRRENAGRNEEPAKAEPAAEKAGEKDSTVPKKKNLAFVVRPQNSRNSSRLQGNKRPGANQGRGAAQGNARGGENRPVRAAGAEGRPVRTERAAQAGTRQEKTDRAERTVRTEKPAQTERTVRTERPAQTERMVRTERPAQTAGRTSGEGRPVRQERNERPQRPGSDRENRPVRDSRDGRGGRLSGDGRGPRQERGPRDNRDGRGGREQGSGGRDNRDGRNGQGSRPDRRNDNRRNERTDRDAAPIVEQQKSQRNKAKDKERDNKKKEYRDEAFEGKGKKGKKQKNVVEVKKPQNKPEEKKEEQIKQIVIPEVLTIKELADKMKIVPSVIVKKLFLQGKVVTVNQEIDYDTAEEIAMEFDVLCEKEEVVDVIEELLKEDEEDESLMVKRPPVVCVMGHVDHGKTSLLDAIRDSNVTGREAGGITQHIGASVVEINGEKITFLDTPGHEAFTAMRMRGANSTDIAILVVAADDGVMPQTIEAINHAKAAGIEIIVAINKIDKPSANIERVKQELTEYELIPEDWGGSTIFVPVSAHTKEGIQELLEMILLTAEVMELKANPNRAARGLVIEAELDKGKGAVATVLVQKGTLHVGDAIAAGSAHGRVRAMMDDKGRRVKEAGPSQPVEILGLNDVPNAGEVFVGCASDKEARAFAETFISQNKVKLLEETKSKMSLDDLFNQIQEGNLKELDIVVKADVQGSVEAIKQSLLKLSNDEVVVKIIHGGVGAINESDVILASASNAIIIGFNVRPDATAKEIAEREGVDLRLYRVIYNAIEDVEAAMKGMLDPVFEEKVLGHAEVRQTFKASGVGTIAGAYVLDGIFERNCSVRLVRDGIVVFDGPLASLKRFKDDVKEVRAGYECGFVFENYNDIKEGDQVEAYKMVETERK
ncbi:translation initiation factor IF-2 [[Ruminococcus] lactaris]|uniref:translation initiation factor IF-2 n=1 Tax=[Ruminococcus] lactaris TaxID=46228 RepID=UPI003522C577